MSNGPVSGEMDARTTVWFCAYSRAVLKRRSFWSDCLDGDSAALPWRIDSSADPIFSSPTPSISTSQTSPAFIQDRRTTSQANARGRSGHDDVARGQGDRFADFRDQRRDIEIMFGGRCALHHHAIQASLKAKTDAPGGSSSAVTSSGPNAPVPSKFFPRVHCGVRLWKSRTDASLKTE